MIFVEIKPFFSGELKNVKIVDFKKVSNKIHFFAASLQYGYQTKDLDEYYPKMV